MAEVAISVIIPTHNRRDILKRCIGALSKQVIEREKYEILVVDDGSIDGTKDMIDELKDGYPFHCCICIKKIKDLRPQEILV
jgi:glycosyltransferase involved in cell wall biosynthesis